MSYDPYDGEYYENEYDLNEPEYDPDPWGQREYDQFDDYEDEDMYSDYGNYVSDH